MAKKAGADLQSTYHTLRAVLEPYESAFVVVKQTFHGVLPRVEHGEDAVRRADLVRRRTDHGELRQLPPDSRLCRPLALERCLARDAEADAGEIFNFTSVDSAQVAELTALTREGFKRFTRQFV
jgi:hypothetical protein